MKLYVVAGPTASGKTKRALELAKEVNGVLINADSRQIYKHLDIGTNKGDVQFSHDITLNGISFPVYRLEKSDIEIHLLSFLEPEKMFSVAEYQDLVFQVLDQIPKEKTPILVGGTGLYIDAVINPQKYSFAASTQELRGKYSKLTVRELQNIIRAKSPKTLTILNNSDLNNPRRLVNLIIKLETGSKGKEKNFPELDLQIEYLHPEIEELEAKIVLRVEEMFKLGIVDEVQKLLNSGYPKSLPILNGIGYKQVLEYLEEKLTIEETKRKIITAHRQYAKKQITWFDKYLSSSATHV